VFLNVGPAELAVILFVALIVFGPHRLPEVGRQIGNAMRELRKMQEAVKGELDGVLHPDFTPAPKTDDEPPALEEPDHTVYHHPLSQPSEDPDDGFAGPTDSFL
jgi:TatA/E family protein of Tat protein translocase